MAKKKKGLGDIVEDITTVTGIKSIVKFIAGEDCGCDERKEKLNNMFKHFKNECLTENEYNYLKEYVERNPSEINVTDQRIQLEIYNRIFNTNELMSACEDCIRKRTKSLIRVYETYNDNN